MRPFYIVAPQLALGKAYCLGAAFRQKQRGLPLGAQSLQLLP